MSESTADNAMEPSDISIGDNEPSMEDILASIRKIIADDKTGETAVFPDTADDLTPLTLEVETEDISLQSLEEEPILGTVEADDFQEPIRAEQGMGEEEAVDELIPETQAKVSKPGNIVDDEKDILELINFVDDKNEGSPELVVIEEPAKDIPTEPKTKVAEASVGFDEGLDLVMDADASDYATTTFDEPDIIPENLEDVEAAAGTVVTEMESVEERLANAQEQFNADTPYAEQDIFADDNIVEKPSNEDAAESKITEDILDVEELEETAEEIYEDEVVPEAEDTIRATPDEDMSLVKSLLADLMDEPGEDARHDDMSEKVLVSDEDNMVETPDTILDNILNSSIEDEVQAQVVEAPEDEAESDLARIAREAFEASDDVATETLSGEDVVDLGDEDISSKFALVAGAAAAGSVAALASDDEIEDLDGADFNVENEIELGQDEQALQETITTEEDEPMVRIVKTDSLVDENTQKESGDAFASLTSAVREKTKLEESGPAIGDLVQEALKPMLKEWLDKNLKGIVERAVTKEVKRISSGK